MRLTGSCAIAPSCDRRPAAYRFCSIKSCWLRLGGRLFPGNRLPCFRHGSQQSEHLREWFIQLLLIGVKQPQERVTIEAPEPDGEFTAGGHIKRAVEFSDDVAGLGDRFGAKGYVAGGKLPARLLDFADGSRVEHRDKFQGRGREGLLLEIGRKI